MTRFIGPTSQTSRSAAQPAAPALLPPAAPLPLPQWDTPAPEAHDPGAHPEPPSWLTSAEPAVLEAKISADLPGVLRVMLGRALLDQTAEQSWHRTDPAQVPPLGRLFLDSLDHLPVSARSRQRVLDGAVHKPDLPDWVRLQVAQAAVQARRVDVPRTLLTIRALQNRRDRPDHVSDFGLALGSRVVDTVVGLYSLVKFIAWDITAFRMVVDPTGYAQMVVNTGQTLGAMRGNPGLIWDALTRDVREAWEGGEYGKALGYLSFDVGTAVVGVPGAARAAATVPGKLRVVIALARDSAGQVRTKVTQVGDDLARGMELTAQDLAGGRVATAGAAPQRGAPRPAATTTRNQASAVSPAASSTTVLPDPARLSGLARQLNLAKRCSNWDEVRPFIGKKAGLKTVPPGYKYAKIPLQGGGFDVFAYVPDARRAAQAVPKLKRGPDGTWEPTGMTWEKGKVSRDYRLSQSAEYTVSNPPPGQMIGRTQNHHLTPDSIMRASPVFQELFRRGLISPDRAANISVADNLSS